MPMNDTDREIVVREFCHRCVWVKSIRNHFRDLFETDERRLSLLAEVASAFFHDLNLLMQEYILLEQSKLTAGDATKLQKGISVL